MTDNANLKQTVADLGSGGQSGAFDNVMMMPEKINDVKTRMMNFIDGFLEKYRDLSIDSDDFRDVISSLDRARKEFDSTRFFVLIAGPLKSGKSSFVNILTRKYISPTDVLECTALPSIIGKATGDFLGNIVSYRPCNGVSDEEAFEHIIDVLRGIEDSRELSNYVEAQVEIANESNLKNRIMNNPDDAMIAAIGVEGSTFLNDQMMIIDMPGLDGIIANQNNPLYKRMVERADFIFFVQSTTSAINEATGNFLIWLLNNEITNVPLRLIHNIHDSMYFIKDDITDSKLRRQIERAEEYIRSKWKGYHDFKHHTLNFAKIASMVIESDGDNVKEKFKEELLCVKKEFEAFEEDTVNALKAERQAIKDGNNIRKARATMSRASKKLTDAVNAIDEKLSAIRLQLETLDTLNGIIEMTEVSFVSLLMDFANKLSAERIVDTYEARVRALTETPISRAAGDIWGKELKEEIDTLAKDYDGIALLGKGSNVYVFLKNTLGNLLKSHFSQLIDEKILPQLKMVLLNNTPNLMAGVAINEDKLPHSLSSFVPRYSDIEEYYYMIGLIRRRKYYNEELWKEYIVDYRNSVINELPNKLDLYKNNVAAVIDEIFIEYKGDIKARLDSAVNSAKESLDKEIGSLNSKRNLFIEMHTLLDGAGF